MKHSVSACNWDGILGDTHGLNLSSSSDGRFSIVAHPSAAMDWRRDTPYSATYVKFPHRHLSERHYCVNMSNWPDDDGTPCPMLPCEQRSEAQEISAVDQRFTGGQGGNDFQDIECS